MCVRACVCKCVCVCVYSPPPPIQHDRRTGGVEGGTEVRRKGERGRGAMEGREGREVGMGGSALIVQPSDHVGRSLSLTPW